MKPSESFEQKSHAEMSGDVVVQLMQLFDRMVLMSLLMVAGA
jgi:hypothetical protein